MSARGMQTHTKSEIDVGVPYCACFVVVLNVFPKYLAKMECRAALNFGALYIIVRTCKTLMRRSWDSQQSKCLVRLS